MKDSRRSYAGLVMAMAALVRLTSSYVAEFFSRTLGTDEPFGPANFFQGFGTGLFRAKPVLPFEKRNCFHFHSETLLASVVSWGLLENITT